MSFCPECGAVLVDRIAENEARRDRGAPQIAADVSCTVCSWGRWRFFIKEGK